MTRTQEIQAMRDLLDFVEERPEIPMPYFGTVYSFARPEDGDDLRTITKAMSPARKVSEGNYFSLERTFGRHILSVTFPREEVCERIEVGEKIVAAVPQHVEKVYEWKCPDSILSPSEDEKENSNDS